MYLVPADSFFYFCKEKSLHVIKYGLIADKMKIVFFGPCGGVGGSLNLNYHKVWRVE